MTSGRICCSPQRDTTLHSIFAWIDRDRILAQGCCPHPGNFCELRAPSIDFYFFANLWLCVILVTAPCLTVP
jgi:hypothetical protein